MNEKNTALRAAQDDDELRDAQVHALLLKYMPFARKAAWRYAGRGAEYEDLVQEAAVALLELIRRWLTKCPPQTLTLYLFYRLPGRVRSAAHSLRNVRCESLEAGMETGYDVPSEDFSVIEILHGLSSGDQALALELAHGYTQKELARRYHVSQQAISKRLHKLRNRLSALRAA